MKPNDPCTRDCPGRMWLVSDSVLNCDTCGIAGCADDYVGRIATATAEEIEATRQEIRHHNAKHALKNFDWDLLTCGEAVYILEVLENRENRS